MNNNERQWQNPFEKNIVEDWKPEEFPRNYIEMIKCFQSPEFMNILESIDVRPKILMGGRGTGKSHILRMLSVQGIVHKIKIERAQEERKNPQEIKIKLGEYKVPYFGIYLKAIGFSPLSKLNITYLSEDQVKTLFEHFFNVQIAVLILDGIKFLIENCEDIPKEMEESICVKLSEKYPSIIKGKTYSEIKKCLENEVDTIRRLIRELPWFKVPDDLKEEYPPKPFSGIQYESYELSQNAIIGVIEEKILPTIKKLTEYREQKWCWTLKGECKHKEIRETSKVFVGLPYDKNPQFFKEIEDVLNNFPKNKKVNFFKPAQTLNELCQLCKGIKESSFCIIDTSYNDYSMLFALGVAFSKDKKFIQLHNTSLSPERPISDLRQWAIEYVNTFQLKQKLGEELKKRLEGEQNGK